MIIVRSKHNIPIRLTPERWMHIVRRHPELDKQKERLLEVISNPDFIQQGDYGELLGIKFFPDTPLREKYLVVVYRQVDEEDGFVITAYFTRRPLERRAIIWKQ